MPEDPLDASGEYLIPEHNLQARRDELSREPTSELTPKHSIAGARCTGDDALAHFDPIGEEFAGTLGRFVQLDHRLDLSFVVVEHRECA